MRRFGENISRGEIQRRGGRGIPRKPQKCPWEFSVSSVVICLTFAVEVRPLTGLDEVGPVEGMELGILLQHVELHLS
jgi:hypothetical protein